MYQALYRKWRPKRFDDVVGQSHITETLKNQVRQDRLSHAYLFTGTRGTGKTTCAKILAKAVNCEQPVEGNACGICPACTGIDSGSILDVVELDAASNNGVDQVRALRDEAIYAPAAVRCRVYIVDEVHMLSVAAFNALLKILEEPPEHLIFILATTELHKVPATILSRCQRFSFKRILPADIQNRLRMVAEREGIDLTDEGAALLARLADGALRDALSLLDQCAVSKKQINRETVLDTLGLAGNLKTAHILNAVRKGDSEAALTLLAQLYDAGKDISAVLAELAALVRDLLIQQTAPTGGETLLTGGYDEETLYTLSKGFTRERLLYLLRLLQETQAGLRTSANRRTDAELCLIQMSDLRLDSSLEALVARIAELEARTAGVSSFQAVAAEPQLPDLPPESVREERRKPVEREIEPEIDDLPPWDLEPSVEEETVRQSAPKPVPSPPSALNASPETVHEPDSVSAIDPRNSSAGYDGQFWAQLVPCLRPLVGPAAYPFLSNPEMTDGRLEGNTLTLYLNDNFTRSMVERSDLLEKVAEAATSQQGSPVQVRVKIGKPSALPVSAIISPQQATEEAERPPEGEEIPIPEEAPPEPTDPFSELIAFGELNGMTID